MTRARLSERTHSQPSTMMMAASSPSRASAVPGWPCEASWMACAARPGGSQRIQASTPAKLAAVIPPCAAALGITWPSSSIRAKIGMNRNAARSLPRRERSSLAMLVVTSRARVMQNSTCSATATTATSRPSGPLASPTVTPSRPIRLAAGQAPAAEAASSPTASGRVRSGYSCSVAGSRVPSRPNAKIGRVSQPSANAVKMTVVRSTDALRPRNRARTVKAADRHHDGEERAEDERGLRGVDERSALSSSRSFSWTRSRAMTAPPHRVRPRADQVDERLLQGLAAPHLPRWCR